MRWFPATADYSATPSEVIDFPLQRGYANPLLAPLIRFHRKLSPHARPLRNASVEPARLHRSVFRAARRTMARPRHLLFARFHLRVPGPAPASGSRARSPLVPRRVHGLPRFRSHRRLLHRARRVRARQNSKFFPTLRAPPMCARRFQTKRAPCRPPSTGSPVRLPESSAISRAISIGNCSSRSSARTPGFSWAFIGPASMTISGPAQRRARAALLEHGGRVRFTGSNHTVRCNNSRGHSMSPFFPTVSANRPTPGSATRFYEHLAACRPMLATPNVARTSGKATSRVSRKRRRRLLPKIGKPPISNIAKGAGG